MDRQPIVCNTCTGVLLTTDSRDYTTQRGRLIVTNGYCSCPPAQKATPAVTSATAPEPLAQRPVTETAMVNA
ncbi:hypothetical protein [Streptosporangium saharense]|uniref:Uncharacterized protein n=1 Tax=Streptosporangium saharense TaxID=1706840 RepID=A0A7W7QVP0_9ACTN|nr:hypothetical protein [Streptosporangium saharense]MBB4920632.1 hypothetical protein [Streptosporangium saharense]